MATEEIIGSDMSARSEAFFESLLNELADGVLVTDEQRQVILINRVFSEILGGPCCSVLEQGLTQWLASQGRDAELRWTGMEQKVLVDGVCQGVEFLLTDKHGGGEACYSVNATLVHVPEEDGPMIVTIWRNITASRQAENRLKQALDEANVAKGELTQAYAMAKQLQEAAEAANVTKSTFLANMSHEIRTPMNAVLSMLDLALDEEPDATLCQYLQTSKNSARNLLALINDILDISKIEAGKMDICTILCSTKEILHTVYTSMAPKAAEKGLDFDVILENAIPAQIETDPVRLQQCLINLVGNAIKFTHEGHVYISASLEHREQGPCLCFNVEDSGIGISSAKQEKIFNPFQQADASTTRKYGGTGLGLAITKQLAELMGGEIAVSSLQGKGSTFTLAIPTRIDPQSVEQIEDEQWKEVEVKYHQRIQKRFTGQVLVAEDDTANQMAIRIILRKCGIEVTVAPDGVEALRLAQENEYDLILMDIQMPNMSGLEATEILRRMGCKVPIYALTANAMQADVDRSLNAGCDGHLTKPIDRAALLKTLSQHLDELESTPVEQNQPSAQTAVPSDIPIDWQDLVERLDDEDLIIATLKEWSHTAPDYLRRILEAFQEQNIEQVRMAAHGLKGSAATAGAKRLSRAAAMIEVAAKSDNLDAAQGLLAQVEFEISQVQSFLGRPDWPEILKNGNG